MTNKELWLGNTATMNDKNELVGFINNLKNAIYEDLGDDNSRKHCEDFFNRLNQRLKNEYPFATCFSKLEDDAAQWERYADNAKGVCIVFDTKHLFALFMSQMYTMFNEVFYTCNPREHAFYHILTSILKSEEIRNDFKSEKSLMDNMLAVAVLHKHKGFINECEIRLATLWAKCPNCSKVDFVLLNGVIRKVMKVNIGELCDKEEIQFEDLFSKIIIGPRSSQNELELREFLISCGYNKMAEKVERSNCPLR